MKIKQSKKAAQSKRKSRPLRAVNAEMKAREEFWSDPCWQEPVALTKRSIT